jgi:hypothetical protein
MNERTYIRKVQETRIIVYTCLLTCAEDRKFPKLDGGCFVLEVLIHADNRDGCLDSDSLCYLNVLHENVGVRPFLLATFY